MHSFMVSRLKMFICSSRQVLRMTGALLMFASYIGPSMACSSQLVRGRLGLVSFCINLGLFPTKLIYPYSFSLGVMFIHIYASLYAVSFIVGSTPEAVDRLVHLLSVVFLSKTCVS
jgi:hypothetical protein